MESAAVRILALLGLAAVAACVALLCAGPLIAALEGLLKKWRRLGFVPRVVAVIMAAIATVEAQKSGERGMDDFSRVERVDRVDGRGGDFSRVERVDCIEGGGSDFSRKGRKEHVGVEGEELKLGVEVEQRTDKPSAVQFGLETSTHLLASVKTNESYSYSMPENAVRYPNWWMRGGYEDVFKLELGDFSFPIGTNLVESLWVYTWGKVRPRLKAKELEIVVAQTPMSAVPQVSEFWYMDGTNDSKILTWHNFFVGRVPISELDGSELDFSRVERVDREEGEGEELKLGVEVEQRTDKPSAVQLGLETSTIISTVPISAQFELFPNGDYIARSNLVERYYKRINPDDWDDDGIPNEADANPSVFDGDFFGPQEDELPEGAEASNYCWVDIVVSNANSLVTFVGDKPSNLSDPRFIAKARTTHRVNLLIGKTYRVSSAIPVSCMAKSSDEIYVSGEGTKEMTVVYPVSYEIMDNARSVSRQVRMIPPLVGTFNWASTDRCCDIGNVSGIWIPSCSIGCICEGCTSGGFTFNYEGYSLSFDGVGCGCKPYSGPTEDDGPYDASVSVAFSEKAIIFENAYENKPGESVPKQSTRSVLACIAHGGPNGGRARFTISNAEKLVRLSGIDLPMEVDVPAGNKVEFNIVYEGGEASGSENDIVATAQFIDNKDGALGSMEDELTVVEVELEAAEYAPENPCQNRHIFGVSEAVNYRLYPASVSSDMQMDIEDAVFWVESKRFYCPWIGGQYDIEYNYKGAKFESIITVYNPIVICKEVQWDGIEGTVGSAGQVGMKLWLGVGPSTVSFDGIFMVEIPDDVIRAHEGYFCSPDFNRTGYLSHSADAGAGKWLQVHGGDWCVDEARRQRVYPEPWSEGWKEWNIPVGWGDGFENLKGEILPMPTKQRFTIGVDGSASVEKYGNKIERHINNKVYLNGVLQN